MIFYNQYNIKKILDDILKPIEDTEMINNSKNICKITDVAYYNMNDILNNIK